MSNKERARKELAARAIIEKARREHAQPPTFADELKAWRASAQLSQSEAAERLGVPKRTYEGWESGRKPAQLEVVRKLLRLGVIAP